ncbi:hypothetical protein J2X31_003561 [Flavobacterium arsenatis]|uniref:Toxin-antitoxin system YwqK family antitoxin n=1 Tax=Flavobacterium arsenatis TaxID=1484332 RepID=A0ABU1TUJ1_9FLAO|nr:toxin-antitoxin system YwqK family antitoxin [Flavobacterium arsenatis]MDR6969528.1 hypothetical protein [Flavobacterium arsenatis]
MKNILITTALLFAHFFAFGQIMVAPNENSGTTNGFSYITYKSGKLKETGKYDKNRKEIGEWKFYTESGHLESIGNFINGEKNGEWKFYHTNEKLLSIGNFKNGKETGEWKVYYDDGNLFQNGSYEDGIQTGEWKSYHKNGQLSVLTKYANGKQTGKSKFYNQQGNRIKREQYFSEIEDLMKSNFEEFYALLKQKDFDKAVNFVSEDFLKATSFSKEQMKSSLQSNFDNWDDLPDLKVNLTAIQVQKPKKLIIKENKYLGVLEAVMNFEMTVNGYHNKEEIATALYLIETIGKDRYKIGEISKKDGNTIIEIKDKRLVVAIYNHYTQEVRFAMIGAVLTYTLEKFLPKEIVAEIKSQL